MRLPIRMISCLTGLLLAGPASAQWGGNVYVVPSPFGGSPSSDIDSFLGVYLEDVDAEDVEELDLPKERGALVAEVMDDTPAAEAGLQDRDVIVGWDDTAVHSARQLKRLVAETPAGRSVHLNVIRDGESIHVDPVIGSMSDRAAPNHPPMGRDRMPPWHPQVEDEDHSPFDRGVGRPQLGVLLLPLNDQLGAYFGLDEEQTGVLISGVVEGTPAQAAGLGAGDVLLGIDDEPVASPRDVRHALTGKRGAIALDILRDREPVTLSVQLTEDDPAEEAEDEEEEEDHAPPAPYPKQAM